MSNVGFRIFTRLPRPDQALVESFRGVPTPNIADNMNRFFCVDTAIKPMNSCQMLGTAFTVRSSTADNLLFHKALDMAEPGDVIVIEVRGDTINAVTGEIMMRYAKKRGVAGFLIDGLVRDSGAVKELDFAVFCRGANPMGPYKDGPGEINVPVNCGGVIVNPGDIIVGDEDGVVVVPPGDAAGILKKAKAMFEKERNIFKAIEAGSYDRSWVDKLLKEKKVEYIESTFTEYNRGIV
ncbi:RraA family protein [Marispirochaeta aestuarii]|uniref:RraA family protein n=1 Tax=Marispirochaeta aestuarii TaxID=1963862 RepID=UPI0029C69D3E|nr:RraA family protein [Marispirochaeta aestuarii]